MKSNSEKASELALIGGIISIIVSLVLFVSLQFSYNIIVYLFVAMFFMGPMSIIIPFCSGIVGIVISGAPLYFGRDSADQNRKGWANAHL